MWYSNAKYQCHLGQLVTVWTVHVSNGEQNDLASSFAPLFTSIFPERERNCHIKFHMESDAGKLFNKPFHSSENQQIPGLMTIKAFTDGGYDLDECRMIVCVKSIGARKKCE